MIEISQPSRARPGLLPFLALFVTLLLLCAPAAESAATASPNDRWDDGESSVFTAPKSFLDYNRDKGDQIKPLPQASRDEQSDALSLGWSLRLIGPANAAGPATEPSAGPATGPATGLTTGPAIGLTGPDAEPAASIAPRPQEAGSGTGSGSAPYAAPKSSQEATPYTAPDAAPRADSAAELPPSSASRAARPDWLEESPLWLLVNISSNIPESYFYAPFADGQSEEERLATAGSVMPTELELIDANGEPLPGVKFYYPSGRLKQDVFSGLRLPVYQGEILVLASIPPGLLGREPRLRLKALICTALSCTPFRKTYDLPLNPADISSAPLPAGLDATLDGYRTAPFGTAPAQGAQAGAGGGALRYAPGSNAEPGIGTNAEPSGGPNAAQNALAAYIEALRPRYHVETLEVSDIWRALPLGLLAGFILNFMPCVLPVISLKLGALVGLGGWQGLDKNDAAAKRSRRRFRLYGLCFTLGVLVWFGLLFGVIGFAGLLWGQFFQSQELVLGLTLLLFVMALSMFGLVRIPLINAQVGSKGALPYQAFLGGLLATLLATPCSGPLLGGVLGWAVNQPLPYLGLTLLSVALGMSSPFILMAIRPGLIRFLPKPGPWTITLERVMGFVLLGTVIYLLSMLEQAKLFVVLSALLALAFAAWLWSRPIPQGKSRFSLTRVLALVLIVPALYFPFVQRVLDVSWKSFSAASFQAELGRRNLLVDFTADWCINCRALELTTLTERRLQRWGREYDLTFVRVDLTGSNPDGEALLAGLGSASIPLLAIIPAGEPENPTVLRDLVTPGQLESALKRAFKGR